jgi:hypothetical protein
MPRTKAFYEWDIETIGLMANDSTIADVLDHNHQDRLSDFDRRDVAESMSGTATPGEGYTSHRFDLVLVRDEWEMCGKEPVELGLRLWAYVEAGKLPEFFSTNRELTTIRVPVRFRRELSRITGGVR